MLSLLNLFPRGLKSAPSPPVTIITLLPSDSEYCLSPGHGHLPELHLSFLTPLISLEQLLAMYAHKCHLVRSSSCYASLYHQGPGMLPVRASSPSRPLHPVLLE